MKYVDEFIAELVKQRDDDKLNGTKSDDIENKIITMLQFKEFVNAQLKKEKNR